jgi:hypothetical protein
VKKYKKIYSQKMNNEETKILTSTRLEMEQIRKGYMDKMRKSREKRIRAREIIWQQMQRKIVEEQEERNKDPLSYDMNHVNLNKQPPRKIVYVPKRGYRN